MSTSYVSGTTLGADETAVEREIMILVLMEPTFSREDRKDTYK